MTELQYFPEPGLLTPEPANPKPKSDEQISRKVIISGYKIKFKIDVSVLKSFKISAGWLVANLSSAVSSSKDASVIAKNLTAINKNIEIKLDNSIDAPVCFSEETAQMFIHPQLTKMNNKGVSSAFFAVGASSLLSKTYGNPPTFIKKQNSESARLFLLTIVENLHACGEILPTDVSSSLGTILPQDNSLYLLINKKFLEIVETLSWQRYAATAKRTRVYLFPATFGRLEREKKYSALIGGILAWYDFLLFGLLNLIPFIRNHPFFSPARMVLKGWVGEKDLFTGGAARRLKRALKKGNVVRASEAFWAGWNPKLTSIILKPLYRLLGGNRRPFIASFFTFFFTAIIVHPLWITLFITGLAAILYPIFPDEVTSTKILHPINFVLHGIVIGLWIFWGVVVGFTKWKRLRKYKSLT